MVQHTLPKGVQAYPVLRGASDQDVCQGEGSHASRPGQGPQGAVKIIARLTYRQRYEQSTGRDPFICPHCQGEMAVWRIWHPTYGVIYDEGEVIKRGT